MVEWEPQACAQEACLWLRCLESPDVSPQCGSRNMGSKEQQHRPLCKSWEGHFGRVGVAVIRKAAVTGGWALWAQSSYAVLGKITVSGVRPGNGLGSAPEDCVTGGKLLAICANCSSSGGWQEQCCLPGLR